LAGFGPSVSATPHGSLVGVVRKLSDSAPFAPGPPDPEVAAGKTLAPKGDRARRGIGRRRWVSGAVVLFVVAFLTANSVLFVWPATDQPRHVDAILSLNGTDEQAREQVAISLAEKGYAPVLLFSQGPDACPTVLRVRVVCFWPRPGRTVGEVRFAAAYARQHNWHSLMIVSSRAQVTRARLLMKRCYSGRVLVVPAPFQLLHFPFEVMYEWAALGRALLLDRHC
jgi:hypothetical protein